MTRLLRRGTCVDLYIVNQIISKAELFGTICGIKADQKMLGRKMLMGNTEAKWKTTSLNRISVVKVIPHPSLLILHRDRARPSHTTVLYLPLLQTSHP